MTCDPASKKFWVYNVPICGGFCAPTVNPDGSCCRHVSNEYTVPLSGLYMKIAPLLETNRCCRFLGGSGFTFGDLHRKRLMACAGVTKFISMILTMLALIGGLTVSPDTLQSLYWVHGKGDFQVQDLSLEVEAYLGMTLRYDVIHCNLPNCGAQLSIMGFEAIGENRFGRAIRWSDGPSCMPSLDNSQLRLSCQQCRDSLLPKNTLITSLVTYLPSLTTNCQRSTRFGDVNCQSTLGVVGNCLGLITGLTTLLAFRAICYSDMASQFPDMSWHLGFGFRAMIFATLLKAVDMLCHALVPAPTRGDPLPDMSLEEYMKSCSPEEQLSNEAEMIGRSRYSPS